MDPTMEYDTQRAINNNFYNNGMPYGGVYSNVGNFNVAFNTNDPNCLCISGNSYTIQLKAQEIARERPSNLNSLRVNITGSIIQTFNLCCWITTIVLGSIFVFPLFFICCNWWKRKTFQTYSIDNNGYEALGQLLIESGAKQAYVMIQDSYFDQIKAHILISAISRSKIQNFSLNNIAAGIDTKSRNYTDFDKYMLPIHQYVKYGEISWGRKIVR